LVFHVWLCYYEIKTKLRGQIIINSVEKREISKNYLHHQASSLSSSFYFLSYDWSIAPSKASYPQTAIWCFLVYFQYPVLSLRSFRLLSRLSISSIRPPIFPSVTCFRRQFLRNIWPIPLAFPPFIFRVFLSSLTFCNT